ncbi:MAG TPA: glycosyltransferase [Candidatus Paceibacterota bacterium]|nr:glycosyltransferase [Candidatus Paceibacterota bacterium]
MSWGPDLLIYPFLFIAIYFETFLLVTFLSAPARARRKRRISNSTPRVAIIVPCYNEERTVAATVKSLLALDYPREKLTVVLVDDGSTDSTPKVMAHFKEIPQVTIIRKENGGKHTALNAGIRAVPNAELIGCLDADSFVEPDALREVVACFAEPEVMATTAAMSVHEPKTIFERVQHAEYIFGITVRHILSTINGLYVTPGPFSLYRATVFEQLGGFIAAHQTEDMEMALRMQRAHMVIENAPRARVYTKVPRTLPKLLTQRTRWTSGFLRNVIFSYRDLIANPRHGALGLVVLPFALLSFASGVLLFGTAIFLFGQQTAHMISVTSGIPLSYTLAPRLHFGWFYLPISGLLLLSGSILLITMTFMIIGKRMSHTPGRLIPNVLVYLLLYGFVSPLWLFRAMADTVTGTHRTWR